MTALREVASGVWIASDPVRIVGTKLSANMTVLDLGGGSLLVHSPVSMTPDRRAAVDALGDVAHLYAPNTFHHRWIGEWARAYPDARVHAPSRLACPDLRVDREHDRAPEPAFDGVIDEVPIAGFRLHETALVHRASGTLVVADLVHDVGRPSDAWTKFYTRAMGFYDRVALSRVIRWTGFSDRRAARTCVDALLEHPFERLCVGHGEPVLTGAHAIFREAYAWLRSSNAALAKKETGDEQRAGARAAVHATRL